MLDKILAVVSLAGLFWFGYVLISFVGEPDLWVVTILVLLVASYFIYRELAAGGSHVEGNDSGE